MKKSIYALFLTMLMFVFAPIVADACSGTYYTCETCGGNVPTADDVINQGSENCPAGSSYIVEDINTGKKKKVWVVG